MKTKQNKEKHFGFFYKRYWGMMFFCCLVSGLLNVGFAFAHTINLVTSGTQSIDVTSAGDGTSISTDSITVTTTCRSGYNFTISASVNDTNLYYGGDSSNNTTGTYFSASNGSTALNNAPNTWGYYYNNNAPTTAPTSSSIFSAVPALSNTPATIKTTLSTPAASDISDTFNIYYGVAVGNNMNAGVYKMIPDTNNSNADGTIVYNVTMAETCIQYTVNFNPTSTATGSNVSGTGTMGSQTIFEGIATNLNTNTFTAPSGYEFAGWNTAQDGTGTTYTNGQSVTDLTTVGSTITLYAQWEEVILPQITASGKICYYANTRTAEGTMGCQTISNSDTYAFLFASNFSRTGYGFAGWSDVYDYNTNANAHFYGPNDYVSFTAGQYTGSNPGLSLYAVWVKSTGYLQDATKVAELCGTGANSLTKTSYNSTTGILSATLSSVSALTDNRDNQSYAIAKLADGNCWMIENLRLADTHREGANTVATTLTTANTNKPLNNGNIVTLKHNYTDSSTFTNLSATSNVAYNASTAPSGWCSTNSAACNDQSRLRTDNTANRATYTNGQTITTSDKFYSYGNYYNWYSATAGRGTYSKSSGDTNGDLCPLGWKLPYGGTGTSGASLGGTSGGFSNLDKQMGGTGENNSRNSVTGDPMIYYWKQFPNNYLNSGYLTGATLNSAGLEGSYWSSTAYSSDIVYVLAFYGSVLNPSTSNAHGSKYIGRMIRCVVSL